MAVLSASPPGDLKLDKVDKELQFLQLRQQLKASIRDKMKKETASLCSSSQKKMKLTKSTNSYSSFFGCSQSSIAPRVIQDTKSVAKFKQLAAGNINSAASKAVVPMCRISTHELKASRDYSFIFSDNVENPTLSAATSKIEASDLKKADPSKPQLEQKKDDQLVCDQPKKVNVVMPSKMKIASLHKGLIGSKAPLSKKQVGRGKEFRRVKEVLLPPQPQGKSLPKHQIKKRPMQEPVYDDEVDQSYNISSLCQSLFRRNHNKHAQDYVGDYDDDCMVASFDEIQKEEKRSAILARKEDRTEQLRIEQDEMEERLKRKAKKQKLL